MGGENNLVVTITINPYQGLKHYSDRFLAEYPIVTITINPYQGLKLKRLKETPIVLCYNNN